jgi:hemerythrin-like domain-containing protein
MRHTSRQIILDEHNALSAMLQSMLMMIDRGPGKDAARFFEVLRAMLFYRDEFPERQHHLKESDLLFPRLVLLAPDTLDAVVQLEAEHAAGEFRVHELQHLLLAGKLLGGS